MTLRGMFKGIFDPFALSWSWSIELLEADVVALPVLLRGRQDLDPLREAVVSHLRKQRKKHEEFSDRHFIYFVAKRPRLRLAASRPARLVDHQVELRVLKGDAWFPRKLCLPPLMRLDTDGLPVAPCDLRMAGDRLVFVFPNGGTATVTLFDYLACVDADLGLRSTIEYVGVTTNPDTRPTNLEHRGLLETVYHANADIEEVFVLFNVFHVRSSTTCDAFTVLSSNSLLDQLEIRPESEFIEKLFIDYFEPAQQRCALDKERACLRALERELVTCGVRTVDLTYEVDATSDIYRTGSSRVRAARIHHIHRDLHTSASS